MESTNREIIYQGNSTITVETHPDYSQPVVIKKPSKRHPSQRSLRSLENEYQITRALDAIDGVRQSLGQQTVDYQPALILEYIEGQTLHDTVTGKKLDLRSRLEIAVDLTRILGEIHQLNVIHLDINSNNILIGKETEAVHIIDLGSASYIDRGGYQKVQPDQLLGTLPYIAPEQTGRINRSVDERSDLYSLGVVLYELMTRQLPFDSKDPLELVHQHIAKAAVPPSEVLSIIPEVLSAIILKLLSKNAEDRYQSAAGVQADLEKCLQRLSPEDTIEEFPLGEADYARWFRFPQKLYGRDRELRELKLAFEGVCRDTSAMMFVGGYSGIGKTALVKELQQPVSEKGGYFLEGKFDQLTTTPYAGITQAFAQFVSQILTQPEIQLTAWWSKILEAVGPNGRVLTDVVPSLELVIGPQPDVPDLSGQEAQNRFNYVFQRFFSTIARSEHPICLFLDDLQWTDPASLSLLKSLFISPDLAHLLVVGAYRDNEVDEAHPLMALIADLENVGVNLRQMTLQKLPEADVDALISDALRCDPVEIRELSRLVYSQSDGNPFFTLQVLRSLEDQNLIAIDTTTGRWRWDMDALRDLDVIDSVVELLVVKMKELPFDIQETLKVAACIGNQFDISTLTVVIEGDDETILDHVQGAVAAGLIWQRDDHGFFVHDRVQEAAYALVPIEERDRTHLMIGRLLLAETDDTDQEMRNFEIANHYNLGANLLTAPEEKLELVRLNLAAGHKARQAAAFATSATYLKQGLTLLGEAAWREHYRLTLEVHSMLIEVCNLNIQYEEVEALFDTINKNAKQDVDAGAGHQALIMSCIARHELGRAITLAESYLERLDVTLENERESDLTIAELYELPEMEDREKLLAMDILMAVITPVLFLEPERLPSVVYTMLNLIGRYGNNNKSGFAYASYAYTLCLMQQYQEGHRFGQLAIDMLEEYPLPSRAAGIMNTLYTNVRHWRQPVHDQIAPLKTCHRKAMQVGDFEYGIYSLLNYTFLLWGSGNSLEHCLAEIEPSIRLSQSKNQQVALQSFLMVAECMLNLTGKSNNTTQLEGEWFSEQTMMSRLEGNQFLLAHYGLLKMNLNYLFGDPGAAYQQTKDVLKYRSSLNPAYIYTRTSFYGALSCIADLPSAESGADRHERLENLRLFEEELELWAEVAPMNYQHQYDLVMAEKSRVSNKHWEATQLYEQAIRGAQENQFVHDQALANELLGQFWLEQSNEKIAELYVSEAHSLYQQWGANAKVDHLEKCYPHWFQVKTVFPGEDEHPRGDDRVTATITQPITPIQLDLESIISASQLLSAETNLDQLYSKMITLVMSNSGAEKAVLLLRQEGDWFVRAVGDITTEESGSLLNQPFDPADREIEIIPELVFNFCSRTKEVLVLGDAQLVDRYSEDRIIQKYKIQSIACLPILSQGKLKGMLYLDNRKAADVFTMENLETLTHLSAQFAVSVENATLYNRLNQKVQELQESEAELAKHRDYLEAVVVERTHELGERVKELDCLYGISRLAGQQGISLEQILRGAADLLPSAWRDPEIASARIILDGQEFKTGNFRETPWRQSSAIVVQGVPAGQVEVGYLEERPDADEGPFQNEERLLLNAVAERLGRIVERKQAEAALRQSEEKYRDLVEKVSDVIYSIGADGIISYLNPAIESFLGLPPEQVVGKSLSQFVHHDDLEIMRENMHMLLSGDNPGINEYRLLTVSGDIRWVRVTSQPIFEDDRITGLRGVLTDITERKQLEEQLEESATAAERQRLARELHDSVTQSLYSLDLFANATQEAFTKGKIDTADKNLQQVRILSQTALTDMRLLIFELHPSALDELGLAGALRARLESVERRSGIKANIEVKGEGVLEHCCDEAEFYAIASEALNNTLKHAQAKNIAVIIEENNRLCRLSVTDDGTGFDPQNPENERGYGLKNMRERAEKLGGLFSLETSPGEGTTIRVEVSK